MVIGNQSRTGNIGNKSQKTGNIGSAQGKTGDALHTEITDRSRAMWPTTTTTTTTTSTTTTTV